MNIDGYLGLLNARIETNTQAEQLARKDIERAIHGKATNLAAKINKAIMWETASILVVLGIVCAALVFYNLLWVQLLAGVALLICGAMLGVYVWKYRQLNQLVQFEQNTTILLQNLIIAVKQFIKLYHWMMVASIIIGAVLGGVYGAVESTLQLEPTVPSQLTEWYAIPLSVILVASTYWITRVYVNWVYGKPLQDLENCLDELSAK